MADRAPIAFLIPTKNEEVNLPHALASIADWAQQVFVLDSGSTDRTEQITREYGATFVYHPWEGYARQKNWGLDNLPITAKWVFILDADEAITPKLREELVRIATEDKCAEDGFYVNRHFIFMGRIIRHSGYYPSWNVRFFRRGKARYEEREVHEHMIVDGKVGYLKGEMEHHDRRGLERFVAKHNHYSTLEAREVYRMRQNLAAGRMQVSLWRGPTERRRWLKQRIWSRMPARWLMRFVYMYIVRLGFLDGSAGFHLALLLAEYEHQITLKLHELESRPEALEGPAVGLEPAAPGMASDAIVRTPPQRAGRAQAVAPRPVSPLPPPPADTWPTIEPEPESPGPEPAGRILETTTEPSERPGVSVLILTYNEEVNLPACLESLKWCDDIVVLDSLSTDRTIELARAAGARIVQRRFDNWSSHQNWAVRNIQFKYRWVYYSDADEVVTPELAEELQRIAKEDRPEVAYRVRFKNMFCGRWLRRSSLYPTWVMRFFLPSKVRWERLVNPVPGVDGPEGRLEGHFLHYTFRKGLAAWYDKHNKYSDAEAREAIKVLSQKPVRWRSLFSADAAVRRAALKDLSFRIPCRAGLIYLYLMFVRGGVLDGQPGWIYCRMRANYEYMIQTKIKELMQAQVGQTL